MADDFDEFFDDERTMEAAGAGAPMDAPERDVPVSGEKSEHGTAGPSERQCDAKRSQVPAHEAALDRPQRQAPPFWMVLAIAGVSLLLGAVIGYLVGTTATINKLGSGEGQPKSQPANGGDSAVEMPEGHPDIELDEEGNATVAEGIAASDSGDAVSDDPLTLANNFFDMGMSAMNSAQTAEDQQKAQDAFKQAIAHYDEYLEGNSSPAAEVDRAICVFYAGDHERAIADLEAFVKRDATFAPAWANLGMFYESHGDASKAKRAYQKAVDAAAEEDTYGVGDYARQRLDALSK